ncbi:hypothetical protein OIDMADRAFT_29861 [Oidiodendron maius Zn]|uniref:Uncharacterized protein n=1 Tax=Oidiodendron maius (strain Zn) TaxID=913774 RepID=A0A0C3GXK0_OIDMZ|nr:hypothetical protein OIDMADRAFT_29861 [Oidiodendron maius Zn]
MKKDEYEPCSRAERTQRSRGTKRHDAQGARIIPTVVLTVEHLGEVLNMPPWNKETKDVLLGFSEYCEKHNCWQNAPFLSPLEGSKSAKNECCAAKKVTPIATNTLFSYSV